jgi:hypothetical protein
MPAAAIAAAGGNRKSGAFPRPANVPLLPAAPSTPRSNSVSAASGPSTPRRGSGVAPPASPRSNVSGDSGANGIAEARPVLLMDRPISHVRAKRDPKIFNPEDKSNGKRIYLVSSSPSPPSKKKRNNASINSFHLVFSNRREKIIATELQYHLSNLLLLLFFRMNRHPRTATVRTRTLKSFVASDLC